MFTRPVVRPTVRAIVAEIGGVKRIMRPFYNPPKDGIDWLLFGTTLNAGGVAVPSSNDLRSAGAMPVAASPIRSLRSFPFTQTPLNAQSQRRDARIVHKACATTPTDPARSLPL